MKLDLGHARPSTRAARPCPEGYRRLVRLHQAKYLPPFVLSLSKHRSSFCDAERKNGPSTSSGRTDKEIGRASCRERVCQYVYISVAPVPFTQPHPTPSPPPPPPPTPPPPPPN